MTKSALFRIVLNLGLAMFCCRGAIIFQNNFDSLPLGPIGTQPNTNPLPLSLPTATLTDSSSDTVNVVGPTLGLTTQSVEFSSVAGQLAAASFINPTASASGEFLIQWTSVVSSLAASTNGAPPGVLMDVNGSGGILFVMSYDPSGQFLIGNTLNSGFFRSYTPGVPDAFQLLLNLNSHTWSL